MYNLVNKSLWNQIYKKLHWHVGNIPRATPKKAEENDSHTHKLHPNGLWVADSSTFAEMRLLQLRVPRSRQCWGRKCIPGMRTQHQWLHPALSMADQDKSVFLQCNVPHAEAHTCKQCPRTQCLQRPAWTRWSLQEPAGRPSSPQLSYGCFKTCFPGDLLNSLILVLLKIC